MIFISQKKRRITAIIHKVNKNIAAAASKLRRQSRFFGYLASLFTFVSKNVVIFNKILRIFNHRCNNSVIFFVNLLDKYGQRWYNAYHKVLYSYEDYSVNQQEIKGKYHEVFR